MSSWHVDSRGLSVGEALWVEYSGQDTTQEELIIGPAR